MRNNHIQEYVVIVQLTTSWQDFCPVHFSYPRMCATECAFNKHLLAVGMNIGATELGKIVTKKKKSLGHV